MAETSFVEDGDSYRTRDLAYVAHREAFVQQSAAARPVHLARGFSTALAEACPKGISVANIARMNREYLRASLASRG